MASLPNPFDSSEPSGSLDEAAAFQPQMPSLDAAAEFVELGTDCIGEIFVGARKLDQLPGIFDPAAITGSDELLYVTLKLQDDPYTADLVHVPQGLIDEMEPMPLFLQQASGF